MRQRGLSVQSEPAAATSDHAVKRLAPGTAWMRPADSRRKCVIAVTLPILDFFSTSTVFLLLFALSLSISFRYALERNVCGFVWSFGDSVMVWWL